MAGGRSTINTVLKSGTTTSGLTKLCKIKTYPQLGGSPEKIETTDLEDIMQTFVEGVQSVDDMQFTVNYEKETYESVKARIKTDKYFQLEFGESGRDGIFSWMGSVSQFVNGGEVNGLREATLVCTPSTQIKDGDAETAFESS